MTTIWIGTFIIEYPFSRAKHFFPQLKEDIFGTRKLNLKASVC
jgi:hypothetical protein